MLSTGQDSSISRRTMLSTPPRFRPGEAASLRNTTGTSTVTRAPAAARMKSRCSGSSLTGCSCASRGSTRSVSPPRSSSNSELKKRGLVVSCRLISLARQRHHQRLLLAAIDDRPAPCPHGAAPGPAPPGLGPRARRQTSMSQLIYSLLAPPACGPMPHPGQALTKNVCRVLSRTGSTPSSRC